MNILAEELGALRVDTPGVWHIMLPRGTAHSAYLPMLCCNLEKKRNAQLARAGYAEERIEMQMRRCLSVLPSPAEVSYLSSSDSRYYGGEILRMDRKEAEMRMREPCLFSLLCRSNSRWILDCHDLLEEEGSSADGLVRALLEGFEWNPLRTRDPDDRMPYALVIHSASPRDVEARFPRLLGRCLGEVVPPPSNKLNVIVRNVDTTDEFASYVSSKLASQFTLPRLPLWRERRGTAWWWPGAWARPSGSTLS